MLSEEEELLIIQRLHRVLRPFILRRTKALVLDQLPPKREEVIWVPLTVWQRRLYRSGLRRVQMSKGGSIRRGVGQANVMALRKAVNHPYHFEDADKPRSIDTDKDGLWRSSGKMEFLHRVLPRLLKSGHKVLIFTQMTSMLDMLDNFLVDMKIEHAHIDGRMSFHLRKQVVDRFKRDEELLVLLLSIRAGNVGLNLQAADTVILFDSDWNPQMDLQAMDRVHRIGQNRPVLIIRLMTPTSLDLGILRRTGKKLEIEQKVIGAGDFHQFTKGSRDSSSAASQRAELLRDLVREARQRGNVVSLAAPEPMTLAEVNRRVSRSPEEQAAWDAEDEALLGPVAAADTGGSEGVTERLERCGRLISADEVPRIRRDILAKPPPSPMHLKKRRRT